MSPAKVRAHDLEAYRNPPVEDTLTRVFHVEFSYWNAVRLEHFDRDKSLKNQARIEQLDPATAQRYADAIKKGAKLPAVIAYNLGTGRSPRYVIIDGNHRLEAHRLAEMDTIAVYEIPGTTKPQAIQMMTFLFNTQHGKPTTTEERLMHAKWLVANNSTQKDAADALGLTVAKLRNAIKDDEATQRLKEAGVDIRAWEALSLANRRRLFDITTDEGFAPAVKLAFEAKLDFEEVSALVTDLNTNSSGVKQARMVKDRRSALKERIEEAAGGMLTSGAKKFSPRARLGAVTGHILAMPEDPSVVTTIYAPAERDEAIDKFQRTIERLQAFVQALQEV